MLAWRCCRVTINVPYRSQWRVLLSLTDSTEAIACFSCALQLPRIRQTQQWNISQSPLWLHSRINVTWAIAKKWCLCQPLICSKTMSTVLRKGTFLHMDTKGILWHAPISGHERPQIPFQWVTSNVDKMGQEIISSSDKILWTIFPAGLYFEMWLDWSKSPHVLVGGQKVFYNTHLNCSWETWGAVSIQEKPGSLPDFNPWML